MPLPFFLLLRIALVQHNKPDYPGILTLILTLAALGLAGVWLGHLGRDLGRSQNLATRLGGGLLLLLAGAVLLSLLALIYWAAPTLLALL
jgi:hypothetical protein